MKQAILDRIKQLGGNVDNVKGQSLKDDLLSITFDSVLYPAPEDTPWATAEETEPIYGIGKFFDANERLFKTDRRAFYDKLIAHYYVLTDEPRSQMFWQPKLFTPFRQGTADYDEWNDYFLEDANLDEIRKLVDEPAPDFIGLVYSYGFPDNYYICLTDPDPENPTLFGTDHEEYFCEISNEGQLEDFLKKFMTKEELVAIIEKATAE